MWTSSKSVCAFCVLGWAASAAWAQPVTYLAGAPTLPGQTSPFYQGQMVTIKLRALMPNGAATAANIKLAVRIPGSFPERSYSVEFRFQMNSLQVCDNGTFQTCVEASPRVGSFAFANGIGFAPFRLMGYNLVDPALSGKLLQLDVTLRRAEPFVGFRDIVGTVTDTAGATSLPGAAAKLGDWDLSVPLENWSLEQSTLSTGAGATSRWMNLKGQASSAPQRDANSASWLNVGETARSGFQLVVSANQSPAPRTGTLTISNSSGSQTLTVTQVGMVDTPPQLLIEEPLGVSADGTIRVKMKITAPNGPASMAGFQMWVRSSTNWNQWHRLLAWFFGGQATSVEWMSFNSPSVSTPFQFGSMMLAQPMGPAALQLVGISYPDPHAMPANAQIPVEVVLRRGPGLVGPWEVAASATDILASQVSMPGPGVPQFTWNNTGTPAPDFTLTAPTTITVPAGQEGALTAVLTPVGAAPWMTVLSTVEGLNGSDITPNATVLDGMGPKSAAVRLPPASAPYSVTLQGRGAGLLKQQVVNVAIADFNLTAPPSVSAPVGQPGSVSVTLTPVGAPPLEAIAVHALSSTGVALATATATLPTMEPIGVVLALPAQGSPYPITIRAQAGTGPMKTAAVNVAMAPWVSLALGSQSVVPFGGATVTLPIVLSSGGFSGPVSVSCVSPALGVSCAAGQFMNVSSGSAANGTLQVMTSAGTPAQAPITVIATPQGAGAPSPQQVLGTVNVVRGFTVEGPASLSAFRTVPTGMDLVLRPSGGFTGAVNISCAGVNGFVCSGTANISGTAPVSLRATGTGAIVASGTLIITGTPAAGGAGNATLALPLAIQPVNAAVITNPSGGVPPPGVPRSKIAQGVPVTFEWAFDQHATGYRLQVNDGSVGPLRYDQSTNDRVMTLVVRPAPPAASYSTGNVWRVSLISYNGSNEIGRYNAEYDIVGEPGTPQAFAPARNLPISGIVNFTWQNPPPTMTAPTQYRLRVGTGGIGNHNLYLNTTTPQALGNALQVGGIPAGLPVYVTLDGLYPGVSDWANAQSFVYNSVLGGGSSSPPPGTVTLSLTLPTGWGIPAITGKTTTFTSIRIAGSYSGPLVFSCDGLPGVSCPVQAAHVSPDEARVPIALRAEPNAPVASGVVTISAKSPADGVIRGTTTVRVSVRSASTARMTRGLPAVGSEDDFINLIYNDSAERTYAYRSDTDGVFSDQVHSCQFLGAAPSGLQLRQQQTYPRDPDLLLTFSATPSVASGDYPFDCQLRLCETVDQCYNFTPFAVQQFVRVLDAPRVTRILPESGDQGTDVLVAIEGSFQPSLNGAHVTVSGEGVSVLPSGTADTPSRLHRIFRIAPNAPLGQRSVEVRSQNLSWTSSLVPQNSGSKEGSGGGLFRVGRGCQTPPTISFANTNVEFNVDTNGEVVARADLAQGQMPPECPTTYSAATDNPGLTSVSIEANRLLLRFRIRDFTIRATATVSATNSSGAAASTDSLRFILTPYLQAVGFIDSQRMVSDWLGSGLDNQVTPSLRSELDSLISCTATLLEWAAAGEFSAPTLVSPPRRITTAADRGFANFFVGRTADTEMPNTVSPDWNPTGGRLRLAHRFQAGIVKRPSGIVKSWSAVAGREKAWVGGTPEPCTGLQLVSIAGELHPRSGEGKSVMENGFITNLAQVRAGALRQSANKYVNWREDLTRTDPLVFDGRSPVQLMPWVWNAIRFDSEGILAPFTQDAGSGSSTINVFPTMKYWLWGRQGAADWQSVLLPANQSPVIPQQNIERLFRLDAVCFQMRDCY